VNTTINLLLLFVAFAIGSRLLVGFAGVGFGLFSQQTSELISRQLSGLFLFNDVKKLTALYLISLIALPLLAYFTLGPFFTLVVGIVVLSFPHVIFWVLRKQRAKAINHSLPDALSHIAATMRAGATLAVALQGLVDEDTGPLGQELSLLLREHRVGVRLDEALENLAERVQSEEMDLMVSAILIAQDVGGNLAQILQGLSSTIRLKLEMEGKISALTSQGLLQGYVVSALPFGLLGVLCVIEPEATLPIFSTVLGWLFLAVMLVLQVSGVLMIRKIVSIRI